MTQITTRLLDTTAVTCETPARPWAEAVAIRGDRDGHAGLAEAHEELWRRLPADAAADVVLARKELGEARVETIHHRGLVLVQVIDDVPDLESAMQREAEVRFGAIAAVLLDAVGMARKTIGIPPARLQRLLKTRPGRAAPAG